MPVPDKEDFIEQAMANAVASQRLEDAQPSDEALSLMRQITTGELSPDQAVRTVLKRYRA